MGGRNLLSPAPEGSLGGGCPVASLMAHRAEPPDGGWGWMVVLSAFFQSALVFGVLRSFGVFFVEFVAAFEEQAARVSWIASIGIAVQQFGSECCAWVRSPATLDPRKGGGGGGRQSRRWGGWLLGKDAWALPPEPFLFSRPSGQCPEHEVRTQACGDGWRHLGCIRDAARLLCYLFDPPVPEYWAALR